MAAPDKNFTDIPDTAVDAESPLDTTLMTQIRDNLNHLEEWLGKNYTAAVDHDHDGINSKRPAVTNLNVLASYDYLLAEANTERTESAIVYTKKKEVKLGQKTGTLRIDFELASSINTFIQYARIYRNGIAVGIERSNTSPSYIPFSEDIIDWNPDDLIQIYIKSGGVGQAKVKNFKIYSDISYDESVLLD